MRSLPSATASLTGWGRLTGLRPIAASMLIAKCRWKRLSRSIRSADHDVRNWGILQLRPIAHHSSHQLVARDSIGRVCQVARNSTKGTPRAAGPDRRRLLRPNDAALPCSLCGYNKRLK